MVFSSITFLFYFLPIALGLYFIVPRRFRNLVLFLVSLVFYAWGEPVYIVIMLFSSVFDYCNGLLIERLDQRGKKTAKRIVLIVSVVGNLAILGFFKYTDFFLGMVNGALGTQIPLLSIALPIGISFYTFQTMSYSIDVYRGDAPAAHKFIDFGAYVAMFPQLVAGPIVRYHDIDAQLRERKLDAHLFTQGFYRFVAGMCKKVLLANSLGLLFDTVRATSAGEMSVLLAWLGIVGFAFQIYFDFSGYSDMAIGLGKMMGFDFPENFNYPYISQSITEFWRRWHISLGTWFREYLYFPLGGNRKGPGRTYFNLFLVWSATGLWHGANLNFVLWGLYFFVFLVLEKAFLLKALEKAPSTVRHLYTLAVVLISWTLFSMEDFGALGTYFSTMFGGAPFVNGVFLYHARNYLLLLIAAAIASLPWVKQRFLRLTEARAYWVKPVLAAVGLFFCIAYLVSSSYNPFLYFRF